MRTGPPFRAMGRAFALVLAGGLAAACASTGLLTSSLNPQDQRLMEQATQEALEKNRIGQSANWNNAGTGHLGTVTLLRTYQAGTQPCRDFQATLTVEGRTAFAYDSACRRPDGKWQSNSYPGPAGSRFEEQPYGYPYPYDDPYYYSQPGFGFSMGYHHFRRR